MIPKNMHEMSVTECEEVQITLLYEWEREAWMKGALDWSDGTARAILMDKLDRRIVAVQAAVTEA